ncbi:MAG: precorrin-4 C(11)-methyltransferase [Eubacterium sp.]|nr:precorrin-4 C(11)-methyltransferase [Eubacterium sp.]
MVHIVGAGCGAADLITVRGMHLLEEADVVIYAGSLVNPALLDYCKEECRIFNSAEMTLEEVLACIDEACEKGQTVVRLHTGDPGLYGAIQEQMDVLKKKGIPFDITPGVSSFSGAAAAVQREFTLPGISQSLILTRMEGRTPVPERESLKKMAEHGCSMALFLSAGMTEAVQEALLSGAYTEGTPVAVVYKATWPEQRILRCRLGNFAEEVKKAGITKTAQILVGDFLEASPEDSSHADDAKAGEATGNQTASYERSKLYDPGFTTEFRKGTDTE